MIAVSGRAKQATDEKPGTCEYHGWWKHGIAEKGERFIPPPPKKILLLEGGMEEIC